MQDAAETEYKSLTPSVVQIHWTVPTEFPACPETVSERGLEEYADRLTFGSVFNIADIACSAFSGDARRGRSTLIVYATPQPAPQFTTKTIVGYYEGRMTAQTNLY